MFVNEKHAGIAFHVRRANRLAVDLKAILEERGVPSYLYHGTLSGHLRSIHDKGLVPGLSPVLMQTGEHRALAEQVVFFSDTWGGASFFAEAALDRRGAAEGHPVVVRVPEKGLTLEEDPTAFLAGCMMVRGVVSTAEAEVFIGPLKGYPTWRPLAEVVGRADGDLSKRVGELGRTRGSPTASPQPLAAPPSRFQARSERGMIVEQGLSARS